MGRGRVHGKVGGYDRTRSADFQVGCRVSLPACTVMLTA